MSLASKIKEIELALGELIAETIKPSASVDARLHFAHFYYNQIRAILYDIGSLEIEKKELKK